MLYLRPMQAAMHMSMYSYGSKKARTNEAKHPLDASAGAADPFDADTASSMHTSFGGIAGLRFGMGNSFSVGIEGVSSPYDNPADTSPFDL